MERGIGDVGYSKVENRVLGVGREGVDASKANAVDSRIRIVVTIGAIALRTDVQSYNRLDGTLCGRL